MGHLMGSDLCLEIKVIVVNQVTAHGDAHIHILGTCNPLPYN